jgi:hypothetical protein
MAKSTISTGQLSIAMFVYQRVFSFSEPNDKKGTVGFLPRIDHILKYHSAKNLAVRQVLLEGLNLWKKI